MKETSKELLLAEYDRLKTLEQNSNAIYEHSLQFYLTVITAAVGVVVFLFENNSQNTLSFGIILALGLVLLLGEVTYLRLVGEDILLIEISKRYQLIRDKFIKEDSGLVDSFPKILVQSPERFRSWSSIRGIIRRAVSVSGAKTIVVILNCLFADAIFIIILSPNALWQGLVISIVTTILVAFIHLTHSAWRYKNISKQLSKDSNTWWM